MDGAKICDIYVFYAVAIMKTQFLYNIAWERSCDPGVVLKCHSMSPRTLVARLMGAAKNAERDGYTLIVRAVEPSERK